jgi:hypothetical protein
MATKTQADRIKKIREKHHEWHRFSNAKKDEFEKNRSDH